MGAAEHAEQKQVQDRPLFHVNEFVGAIVSVLGAAACTVQQSDAAAVGLAAAAAVTRWRVLFS